MACGGHDNGGAAIDAPGGGGGDGDMTADGNGGGGGDGNGGGPATITLTLVNHPTNAAMFNFVVAYQDGSGAWTAAPAPTGDDYTFTVNAPVYGVAWTCSGTAGIGGGGAAVQRDVTSAYFAVSERTHVTMLVPPRCTDKTPTLVALTGTVSNLGTQGGGQYVVMFGDRTANVQAGAGAYSLETPPATHDLLVIHRTFGNGGSTTDQAVVERDVAVTAATVHNVDWSTAAATRSFTISGPQNATLAATTTLYSAGKTNFAMDTAGGTATLASNALAAAQASANDLYDQRVATLGNTGHTEAMSVAAATPADLTFTAPAPLGGASSTVPATTPYPELKTTWGAYANAVGYTWTARQQQTAQQCGTPQGGCTVAWTTLLSPGVSGASPTYQMPDLSMLAGWTSHFAFVTGTPVNGAVEAMTSTAGVTDFPAGKPAAGTTRTFALANYTVTP